MRCATCGERGVGLRNDEHQETAGDTVPSLSCGFDTATAECLRDDTDMTGQNPPSTGKMAHAAAEARRHGWERIEPSQCSDCQVRAERYLAHVYALAARTLSTADDEGHHRGNPQDGYPLFEAMHAAVRVMHQQPRQFYNAMGNAGPQGSPLGDEAAEHMLSLMQQPASSAGFSDSWDWWISETRTADESRGWLFAAYNSVPPSPRRQRSGDVYLLGAGFSCAVSRTMPTMSALLAALKQTAEDEDWPLTQQLGLFQADDLESWLDALAAPQPYRSDAENAEAAAVFLRVADWLATVPAVDTSDGDPAQTRGQLLATRLVLQEALRRLSADQIADLQAALETVVTGLRDQWSDTAPPEQTHIVDELDAISLRLRYRDQPIEHPTADAADTIADERTYSGVCMKCEHFPIDTGTPCPQCKTDQWVTTVWS